jgi:general secretion pathway protein H
MPKTVLNRGSSKGFTLLELMIVLFVAMLMVGMAVVAMMGRLPAAKLDATVREMSAMMRQARMEAKIQGEPQALVMDLDSGSYGLDGKKLRKIPNEILLKVDDSLAGEMDTGIYRFVFSPFGGIDGGRVILSTGQRSISIRPDPVVGFTVSRKKQD